MGIAIQSAAPPPTAPPDATEGNSATRDGNLFANLLSAKLFTLPTDGSHIAVAEDDKALDESAQAATDPNALLLAPTVVPLQAPVANNDLPKPLDNQSGKGSQTADDLLAHLSGATSAAASRTDAVGASDSKQSSQEGEGSFKSLLEQSPLLGQANDKGQQDITLADGGTNTSQPSMGANHALAAQNAATNASKQTDSNLRLQTPLHASGWDQDLGGKVVWMARSDQQSAVININPPQLGPVNISLNINGDQASATFISPHAEVRQAIEDALPRLREMLSGAGINLGQANVGSQWSGQSNSGQPQQSENPRSLPDNAILRDTSGQMTISANGNIRSSRGAVDLFA